MCHEAAQLDTLDKRKQKVAEHLGPKVLTGQEVVMHACSNPLCMNPLHLVWGDRAGNGNDQSGAYGRSLVHKHWEHMAQYVEGRTLIVVDEADREEPRARLKRKKATQLSLSSLETAMLGGEFKGGRAEAQKRQLEAGGTKLGPVPCGLPGSRPHARRTNHV
jgi:hypothetical protein